MNQLSLRIRVYVAGPISKGDTEENVKKGIQAGLELLRLGYAPFIPHLSHLASPLSVPGTADYEMWLSLDFSWVAACHAILRLPGDSAGADREEAFAAENGIPVYHSIPDLQAELPTYGGDPRFDGLLTHLSRLHAMKQHDYGATADPFANVRASREFGVKPWVGALVRLNDKVNRVKRFVERGSLANESVVDSLKDIAVYSLISLILYQEESAGAEGGREGKR